VPPLTIRPAIVPPNALEPMRGVWQWAVPGATVILPFLSADPLEDDDEALERREAGLPPQEAAREHRVDFSVFTGKPVYPEYRDHLHLARGPLSYVPNRPILRGWDVPGPVAVAWGQVVPMPQPGRQRTDGAVYRFHGLAELYADVGVTAAGELVRQQSAVLFPDAKQYLDWADPQAWAKTGNDKRSARDELQTLGILLNPSAITNTERQIAVRHWLTRTVPTSSPSEPAGAFLLDPSCSISRDGFKSGYHYKEIEASGRFKEVPEKNEFSHLLNAWEYLMARLEVSAPEREREKAPPLEFAHPLGVMG
jgi:hypothetical protein